MVIFADSRLLLNNTVHVVQFENNWMGRVEMVLSNIGHENLTVFIVCGLSLWRSIYGALEGGKTRSVTSSTTLEFG